MFGTEFDQGSIINFSQSVSVRNFANFAKNQKSENHVNQKKSIRVKQKMSGSLYRQMRKLGTEFDQESIVTSQRRRKQPERWSGYVFFNIFLNYASKTRTRNIDFFLLRSRNENSGSNRQVTNYYVGDYVSVKWKDNTGYRGNVVSVQKKRNRTVTIEVECTYFYTFRIHVSLHL